jgi:hypothetical protein
MKNLLISLSILALCLPTLLAQENPDKDRPRPIKDVLPDAKKIDGLFTFYQKKDRLLAEIKGNNLNTDYLIAMAIAKGSGSSAVGGETLNANGADWLWQFRKVNDNIQVVRRNIRYKADPGTLEAKTVEVGFSDSILYSLPIIAAGEGGGDVIDLASIFMADLPRLGIGSFDRSRSTWGDVKGFQDNMEFRVAATYSGYSYYFGGMSGGSSSGGASPDPSAIGVTLHYSISKLPSSGYSPRHADQRIGYFTVSHTNFSRAAEDNHIIRYISRWNLQKADSSATLSPPRKPIVFWIEKTVPFKYRNAVREGILEWNKAFEKVGIVNAIEVRQQSDSDTWDAEDINYNTIRWITSEVSFAMGPSRVNPLTGEILDADIIFDASWVDYWRDRFDDSIGDILPVSPDKSENVPFARRRALLAHSHQEGSEEQHQCSMNQCTCSYIQDKAAHFALASLALSLRSEDGDEPEEAKSEESQSEDAASEESKSEESQAEETPSEENGDKKESEGDAKTDEKCEEEKKDEEPKKEEEKKKSRQEIEKERNEKFELLVLAGIKDVVMHEVGHTLGLRHNFQGSSWLTLDEVNDPNRSKEYGISGSVMDYNPINIAPKGKPQGDYFMTTLGPYDYLAIEYGYKILSGSTDGEKRELAKIASRQAEKGNNYATDEDLFFSIDPRTGTRDLGPEPLAFAQWGLELYNQLLPEILDRAIREDGRYRDVGRFYRLLVSQRYQANSFLVRNLDGLYRNRDRKGDPGDRLPIQVVDAKTKRESVQYLCENTFGADAFKIAPEIYNQFGEEKWMDAGSGYRILRSTSLSLGDFISTIQCYTLEDILSPSVIDALTDTAWRVPESEDAYTVDELFSTLSASVFSELDTVKEGEFSSRKPAIPDLRRTLQEYCFKLYAYYAAGQSGSASSYSYFYPETTASRALARQELVKLESKIQAALTSNAKWDASSAAHLTMLRDRIKKLLEASVTVGRP